MLMPSSSAAQVTRPTPILDSQQEYQIALRTIIELEGVDLSQKARVDTHVTNISITVSEMYHPSTGATEATIALFALLGGAPTHDIVKCNRHIENTAAAHYYMLNRLVPKVLMSLPDDPSTSQSLPKGLADKSMVEP